MHVMQVDSRIVADRVLDAELGPLGFGMV